MIDLALQTFRRKGAGWSFAFGLATELCDRFYVSHGYVPTVISHEGLGYYGVRWHEAACPVFGQACRVHGRIAMAGDIENWLTGDGNRLPLAERALNGETAESLLAAAIRHFGWPTIPAKPHGACLHRRRGASFELVFRITALLAIRHEGKLEIVNDLSCMSSELRALEPSADKPGHPGLTLLRSYNRKMLISGDGRALFPERSSLWERYMTGESAESIAFWAEEQLGLGMG